MTVVTSSNRHGFLVNKTFNPTKLSEYPIILYPDPRTPVPNDTNKSNIAIRNNVVY